MNFCERYAAVCTKRGIIPGSQRAAELFGVTRSNISAWKTKNTMPSAETVAKIAQGLNVSTDYLLCLTDEDRPLDANRPDVTILYERLDDVDRGKVDGFIQGLLIQDKYTTGQRKSYA